jgi:hypothetical protein
MKKITIFIFLLVFTTLLYAAEENSTWNWKGNFASTTYGMAFMPVKFEGLDNSSSNTILMPGIDIRLFNGKNITKRGGFYSGTEVGVLIFFSSDTGFQDTYNGATTGTVTYDIINSDSFIGTVFVLGKYGYRLDLGVKLFGISLGWEMGMGVRIAVGNYDYKTSIGAVNTASSAGVATPDMTMMLDTAVEATVRVGTNLRFLARVGIILTPPFIDINGTSSPVPDVTTVDSTEADTILNSYSIESSPVFATVRVGLIVSY